MINQKGFSLVEISIVLVIIGLLLGGVLKGQELIKNAKITKLYKDMQGIQIAFYAYKDAYGVYPGNYRNDLGRVTSENQFWDDLKARGFISSRKTPYSKDYRVLPAIPKEPPHPEQYYSNDSPFNPYFPSNSKIDALCTQIPVAIIGKYLDDRYDDGNNQTGNIIFTIDVAEFMPAYADIPPESAPWIFGFDTRESYYKTLPGWVCLRLD